MRRARLVWAAALSVLVVLTSVPGALATSPGGGVADDRTGTGPAPVSESVDVLPVDTADAAGLEPELAPVEVTADITTSGVLTQDGITLSAPAGPLRVVGVTWDETSAHDVEVQLRSHDGEKWSTWQKVHAEEVDGSVQSDRGGSEPVAVIDAEQVEVTVTSEDSELLTSAELVVIDPGEDRPLTSAPPSVPSSQVAGARAHSAAGTTMAAAAAVSAPASGKPRINSRASWGADESIRTWRPQLGRVTGAVVHHTAGNNGYTAAQVPGIIRGIYRFHAVSREWGDIGYNVLVDQFGRAWEGRYGGVENAVIGAHATGANSTSFGISLMGNFEETEHVTPAAFRTVAQVIGWVFSWHGIRASESAGVSSAGRIVGHRDVGNTACPGTNVYSRLGELRRLVAQYQQGTPPLAQPAYQTVRVGGMDRYETAVMAQRWTHLISTTNTVFVATGADYADALAAGPVATRLTSPVLLVRPGSAPPSVLSELRRTRPDRIVVLGGPEAVSDAVVRQLRQVVPTVERVSGSDRYDTAARVSRDYLDSADRVYISSGAAFPDALSGGAAAARSRSPMYLTRQANLPAPTAAELRRTEPKQVFLVGGEQVISDTVAQQISTIVPTATITRLAGPDRYATAATVAQHGWSGVSSRVYYATGLDWPDALSGVWAAGARGAPLLLLRGDCAPALTREQTARLDPSVAVLLGGPVAVTDGAIARAC